MYKSVLDINDEPFDSKGVQENRNALLFERNDDQLNRNALLSGINDGRLVARGQQFDKRGCGLYILGRGLVARGDEYVD